MDLLILVEASQEIESAYDRYESKRSGLGSDFELCLESALDRISLFSESSPKRFHDIRVAILPHFPYGVYYKIYKDLVIVLAVFHFKQNPKTIKKIVSSRRKTA